MKVFCPNCGSENEGMPGNRLTCRACTASFEVPGHADVPTSPGFGGATPPPPSFGGQPVSSFGTQSGGPAQGGFGGGTPPQQPGGWGGAPNPPPTQPGNWSSPAGAPSPQTGGWGAPQSAPPAAAPFPTSTGPYPGSQPISTFGQAQPYAAAPTTNPLAIVSLVSGIICCIPIVSGAVAVATGKMALSQIEASNGAQKGKELAYVGMGLGAIVLLLNILGIIANLAGLAK